MSKTFKEFIGDQKSDGIVLIVCTVVSLIITNSPLGENYLKLWHFFVAGLSVEHWINDGLIAVFFLLIGLELERELYKGELSNFKNALLPIFAAIGGLATSHRAIEREFGGISTFHEIAAACKAERCPSPGTTITRRIEKLSGIKSRLDSFL